MSLCIIVNMTWEVTGFGDMNWKNRDGYGTHSCFVCMLLYLHLAIFVGLSKAYTNCVVSENGYYKRGIVHAKKKFVCLSWFSC